MELFKVTCVTCQAKLSVRNAALIGQIVACPRCNSMVEISSPLQEPATTTTSPTLAPAPAQNAQVPSQPLPAISDGPVTNDISEAIAPDPGKPAHAEVGSVIQNSVAANHKFLLWSIASFVIGATVTSGFLVLYNKSEVAPTVIVASSTNEVKQERPPKAVNDSPSSSHSVTEESIDKSLDQEASERKSPGIATQDPASESTERTPLENEVPLEPVANETHDANPDSSEKQDSPEPLLVVEPADEPSIARKIDPLRFDLEQIDAERLNESAKTEESSAALPAAEELNAKRARRRRNASTSCIKSGPTK